MNHIERYRAKIKIKPGEQAYATRSGGQTLALMSLQECADNLGISRQAAHQLERSAFHKIRTALLKELREANPELAGQIQIS